MTALQAVEVYLADWFNRNAIPWTTINAHRQSSKDRRSDPGQEIWLHIKQNWDWTNKNDGGPEYKLGSGHPLPVEWGKGYTADF